MAAIIISLLLISLGGMQFVDVAKANPVIFYSPLKISFLSPNSTMVYGSFDIPLLVTVRMFCGPDRSAPIEKLDWLNYTIDDKESAPLQYALSPEIVDPPSQYLVLGNSTLAGLSNGSHTITIFAQSTMEDVALSRTFNASTTFSVDAQMIPTASPIPSSVTSLSASLAESARSSYLAGYLGDTFNFTAIVEGGKEPYVFTWIVDNQTQENTNLPRFSANNLGVGRHGVFAIVKDVDNNTSTTSSVDFYVLPDPSSTPEPSSSAPELTLTPNPTSGNSQTQDYTLPTALAAVAVVAVAVGALAFLWKRKRS